MKNKNLTYHIWTIGCQMNAADSRYLSAQLEQLGYHPAERPEDAMLVVLNTCVVRQHAEDKAYGRLGALRKWKAQHPDSVLALMGCLVGKRPDQALKDRFPFIDVFLSPSETAPLISRLLDAAAYDTTRTDPDYLRRTLLQDAPGILPVSERRNPVCGLVPIVLGCSHACAFCVIPGRRGAERSRPGAEVLAECVRLADQGVREVTLLGQIVDRYGLDLDEDTDLADLLTRVADITALDRIRFLTSHPNWITDKLLDTVATNEKICPQMEIAVQSGNNAVLDRMRRGYTIEQFNALIERIRVRIPDAALHTDVIVGFPGETDAQFEDTRRLLDQVRFDKVHIAKYSERPRTLAAAQYQDDIPEKIKEERRRMLEDAQRKIQIEKTAALIGQNVEVLVEDRDKDRWRGRTRKNKLVFFEDSRDVIGHLVSVRIDWAGPFSLSGKGVSH